MNRPGTHYDIARYENNPANTPMIPLNYVHPGMSLSQIFSIILGYWKISAIVIVVILAIAIVILKTSPRTYTAELTLMVNYSVSDTVTGQELPGGQLGSYIATQMELMQNQEVLSEVVEKLELTKDKDYAAGYTGKSGTLEQWVVQQLKKDLSVNRGQAGNQLIYLTFSANDPQLAADVANAVADTYKKQDSENAIRQPAERTTRLAEQLVKLKKNVEEAQTTVSEFHRENKLVDEGNRANFDVVMLTGLEDRLVKAREERRLAEAVIKGDRSATDVVLASPEIQDLKKQLTEQKLELKKYEALYTPEHPLLQDFKLSISTTEELIAAAVAKYETNLNEKLRQAREKEKSLQRAVAQQREKVLTNAKLHDDAQKYTLALESAQTMYKNALNEFEKLKFASQDYFSNIRFVNRATPPLKPSKPNVIKSLLMATVMAFMVGFGIPVAFELFNRRVRCRDDLERNHGVPVLAEFSAISKKDAA